MSDQIYLVTMSHILCLGKGFIKPIPRFSFALKRRSVHCLSIIGKSCPLFGNYPAFFFPEKSRTEAIASPALACACWNT